MKRYLCILTIGIIIIILGLFKFGIAFFEYNGDEEGVFYGVIEDCLKDTKYMKSYIASVNKNRFIIYVKKTQGSFKIGDRIKFQGKFSKGEAQRNFGGFDYDLYLKTKKIYGTFKVERFEIIGNEKGFLFKWKKLIYNTKNYIISLFKDNLKQENSALLTGILIGYVDDISNDTMNDFRDSSLTHILAISGANFVLIIQILNIANKKIIHRRLGHVITIFSIIFFMELTGNTASVVRAGVMSVLLIISKLLHRKYDFWTSLAFSTFIQLIYNPYSIFDLGLILSYGGVIGLVLFNDLLQSKFRFSIVSGTISANILIIPIIMYNFNIVSLTFLISNILAEILLIPIMIVGLVSIVFRFKFVFIILDIMLTLLRKIVEICAQIPFSKIYVTTPSIISILFYFILIFLILKKSQIKNFKRKIAIVIVIIIVANFNYPIIDAKINQKLLINMVDVGQGDCTLIRTGSNSILIDGGGSSDSNYDIGKSVDIPYLLDRKVKVLDYVMISHFDTDHVAGLLTIMKELEVKNVIVSKQWKDSQNYQEFQKIVKNKKINVITVGKNNERLQKLQIQKDLNVDILFPNNEKIISENILNNNSIVCKLNYRGFSMLFTGDIEEIAEKQILQEYKNNLQILKATVLKVAHHGSKSSSSQEFLNAVQPKIAIIGVGKDNKFGHPNDGVISRLKSMRSDNI